MLVRFISARVTKDLAANERPSIEVTQLSSRRPGPHMELFLRHLFTIFLHLGFLGLVIVGILDSSFLFAWKRFVGGGDGSPGWRTG